MELTAGWGFPGQARKAHYFKASETFSLCQKYGFYTGPRESGNDDSRDNCADCKRLRATLRVTESVAAHET